MNRLEFYFNCLDGHYFCVCEADGPSFIYSVETDIPGLSDKSGELSEEEARAFSYEIASAGIRGWNRYYLPEQEGIEDAVKWKVRLYEEDKEYVSSGEESYEPYGYEHLIGALQLFEEGADLFLAADRS